VNQQRRIPRSAQQSPLLPNSGIQSTAISTSKFFRRQEVIVPIEPTFEPSQGIREVRTSWLGKDPIQIVFDGRHLKTAEQNVVAEPDPEERFVGSQGGIVNLGIFLNVLRCYGALAKWHYDAIGSPLTAKCIPPAVGTRVYRLWEVLGLEAVLNKVQQPPHPFPLLEYQSRYVSPIIWVNEHNRKQVIDRCHLWIDDIGDRLGSPLQGHLLTTVPEIMTNLVKYGFAGGAFVISVWPSGQAEMLWTNRVDHLPHWAIANTAKMLAEICLQPGHGGSGMAYLLDVLLPTYTGVLAINHRGNDVIFRAGNQVEIYGHGLRGDAFLPRSVLFSLELFSPEVRERSIK